MLGRKRRSSRSWGILMQPRWVFSHPTCTCYSQYYCVQGAIKELKALEAEVQKGFASLQSTINDHQSRINDHKNQIESLIQGWETKFGLSASMTLYAS